MTIENDAIGETYTMFGAKRLADTIMKYWKAHGYAVRAWPEEIPGRPRQFGVKSTLVNGLPRACDRAR